MVTQQRQDKPTDVLVVGAGPTGLMMACQLALRGISFRIIDKKNTPANYSGALFIQARTLEVFDQMGIADTAIAQGKIAQEIRLVFRGKETISIRIDFLGQGLSKFPYLLMLEQSKTEQILTSFIEKYGHVVERNVELVSFQQDMESVTSTLLLPDGERVSFKTQYIVAADGGHGVIREQLAIPFIGLTHPASLFISDCSADIPANSIYFAFTNNGTAGFFPLTEERWRIDGTIPKELNDTGSLVFADIAGNLGDRIMMKVNLYRPEWFSIFHSHQGYASAFHQHRCFILGDAAHLLSPVGAQGMNTGIQDAFNLAWKLALVIVNKSRESILNTYTTERIAIAKNTISSTEKLFKLVTSQHFIIRSIRIYLFPLFLKLFLPFMVRQKAFGLFLFRKISEIGIHYRSSPLSNYASLGNFPDSAPKPGDRLPYIEFSEGVLTVNIQEKCHGIFFYLFVFTKHRSFVEIQNAAKKHADILSIESIDFSPESEIVFERLGLENSGCYLIRPDMYIAYRSSIPDAGHLERYLEQFLIE